MATEAPGALVLEKACACVLRRRGGRTEVLTFLHPTALPEAALQLPKGTLEPGEAPESAVLRELLEESGIGDAMVAGLIAQLELDVAATDDFPAHVQRWHVFHVEVSPAVEARETWEHAAEGSSEEEGLVFTFAWTPVEAAATAVHPGWREAFGAVLRHASRAP